MSFTRFAPRRATFALVLVAAVLACTDATGSGSGGPARLTVSDAPPGPAWNGTAKAVWVGERANCLLNTDGTTWCWGNTRSVGFRLDIGLRNVPATSNVDVVVDSICIARRSSVSSLPGWPCNVFVPVRMSTRVFASLNVPGADGTVCGLDAANDTYCWDDGVQMAVTPDSVLANGVKFCGTWLCSFTPQRLKLGAKLSVLNEAGPLCAVSVSGVVLCRGLNTKNLMGNRALNFQSDTLTPVLGAPASTLVAANRDGAFACAIATTGRVWCWGESLYGAVGNGSFSAQVAAPVLVTSSLSFKAITATLGSICALTTAGAAYCWGDGRVGQIGWNGFGWSTTPAAVAGAHTFTQITSGPGHVCALDNAGAAWCWGDNQLGQLGVPRAACGGGICSAVPVAVQGGLTFRQISAGVAQTCGVTTANQVYCWGWTSYGKLGQQPLTTDFITVPVRIGG